MPQHDTTREGSGAPAADPVMGMLSEHVPLSLLLDMASPAGPRSAELLASEGLPEQEWWVQR